MISFGQIDDRATIEDEVNRPLARPRQPLELFDEPTLGLVRIAPPSIWPSADDVHGVDDDARGIQFTQGVTLLALTFGSTGLRSVNENAGRGTHGVRVPRWIPNHQEGRFVDWSTDRLIRPRRQDCRGVRRASHRWPWHSLHRSRREPSEPSPAGR